MPSKNDLTWIKVKFQNKLPNENAAPEKENTGKAWRKPKPAAEKQSKIIGLRFTPSEKAHIEKLAWLVPIATFLKDKLDNETELFNK